MTTPVRVAIAGVGNCACSLVQGVAYYDASGKGDISDHGVITPSIGGLQVSDIEFVAAFDIDQRKVGRTLAEAIFASPNCTRVFSDPPNHTNEVEVKKSEILDGIAPHMLDYPANVSFRASDATPIDVVQELRAAQVDVLICFLPVGSTQAVEYFANAALAAGTAFVNSIPVPIATNRDFIKQFTEKNLPLIGDDIRSQVGATIVHQRIAKLLIERGYAVRRTHQINIGGNTDFLNMLDPERVESKKQTKKVAVLRKSSKQIDANSIHIGKLEYDPRQKDEKRAYIHFDAEGFGGAPLSLEINLSVHDSPNSAAVSMDVLRYAKFAKELGIGGPLFPVCSYYMKNSPITLPDAVSVRLMENGAFDTYVID